MSYDRYEIVKVRGSDPEAFWIIWVDSGLPKGSFMKTSQNLTESELRAELKDMDRTKPEIDSLIQSARKNPR